MDYKESEGIQTSCLVGRREENGRAPLSLRARCRSINSAKIRHKRERRERKTNRLGKHLNDGKDAESHRAAKSPSVHLKLAAATLHGGRLGRGRDHLGTLDRSLAGEFQA